MSNSVYPSTPKFGRLVPVGVSYPVDVMTTASGKEQRVLLGPKQRSWRLEYPVITASEANTLEAFYDSHSGSYDSFLWTPPTTGTPAQTRVRFGEFSLTHQFNTAGGRMWTASVELVEVAA